MPKQIIVNQQHALTRIAVLETNCFPQFYADTPHDRLALDTLQWGQVVGLSPQGAFVSVAPKIRPLYLPFEKGLPRPLMGESLLVQITREPYRDFGERYQEVPLKGAKATRQISLAGRTCLYYPRSALPTRPSEKLKEQGYDCSPLVAQCPEGFVIRERALVTDTATIRQEMVALIDQYQALLKNRQGALMNTSLQRLLRDATPEDEVILETPKALIEAKALGPTEAYLRVAKSSALPLFEAYGVEDAWDDLIHPQVRLPQTGGSMVIQSTAACHVIDVNTGASEAGRVNREAVPLIAYHIGMRPLGGNIIVDFADIKAPERPKILNHLKQTLAQMAAHTTILGWSKAGWMELRRDRRRAPLVDKAARVCDSCSGWGITPLEETER